MAFPADPCVLHSLGCEEQGDRDRRETSSPIGRGAEDTQT